MLNAAVWAPNHRLNEPWRFFILEQDSVARLEAANLAYAFVADRFESAARGDTSRRKVLEPPLIIFVYCVPDADEAVTRENYAAVCCAVQNICLAGVAEGLSVAWETGGPTRHPNMGAVLGAEDDWLLVGMLAIGFPAGATRGWRTPAHHFARWLR